MKKILVLINEEFHKMSLGINASLSYILSAVDLGYDIYVFEAWKSDIFAPNLRAILLNKGNAQVLIDKFRQKNREIAKNPQKLLKTEVSDCDFSVHEVEFAINEIDFVIQRMEPMNPPFPPYGKMKIDDFLGKFSREVFTKNKKYNLPIDCFGDKELPLEFKDGIAVPTEVSYFEDPEIIKKVNNIAIGSKSALAISGSEVDFRIKIAIKPDDLAQGFGVFAIDFCEKGLDLGRILQENAKDYANHQSFLIKSALKEEELRKILKILLFLQDLRARKQSVDRKIADFCDHEIKEGAKRLYSNKVLIQPFINGVDKGDIRIILAKIDGDFEVIGKVFRKSIAKGDEFKTGVCSGGAIPARIGDILTEDEQDDLAVKLKYVLGQLNAKMRQKYENCYEIGLDFLLFGDGKRVFLGEANHHCQGLVPLLEIFDDAKISDGGLGFSRNIIKNWLK